MPPSGRLSASLTKAHRHQRLSRVVLAGLLFVGAASLYVCLSFVADNLLNLAPAVRVLLAAGFWLAALALPLWLLVRVWLRPIDRQHLAVRLEQLHGIDDNSLVNALCFQADDTVPEKLRKYFLLQADKAALHLRFGKLWDGRGLRRAGTFCACAVLLLALYAAVFGDHARNALARFQAPGSQLAPLNYTQFSVAPGDATFLEGDECLVRATATKLERSVTDLKLLVDDGRDEVLYPMAEVQGEQVYQFRALSQDLRYQVRNGNDASRWFRLRVQPLPRLETFAATLEPPAYTGAAGREVAADERQLETVSGSTLEVRAGAAKGVQLRFRLAGEAWPGAGDRRSLVIDRAARLSIDLTTPEGLARPDAWICDVRPVADQAPRVRFLNQDLNRQIGLGESLAVRYRATDDFGLSAAELVLRSREGEFVLDRNEFTRATHEREELQVLSIAEPRFVSNASYQVLVRVWDNQEPPVAGTTLTPLSLHVVDLAKSAGAAEGEGDLAELFRLLTQTLETQKRFQGALATRIDRYVRDPRSELLLQQQSRVHGLVGRAARQSQQLKEARESRSLDELATGIAKLYSGPSADAMGRVRYLGEVREPDDLKAALNAVVFAQAEVIKALQEILGEVGRERVAEQLAEQRQEEEEQDQEMLRKMEELHAEIRKFKEEQRQLIDQTEEIDKKDPEDWTEEEEELLGDLAAKQADMANFFKASFNDLSKLQNQDFSNSMMAEEIVEMYEELQKAGAALEKERVEIAVAAEDHGYELAESIETNIEKWIADAKDHIKWQAEESGLSPDVPMQDLPAELTDIIGDLIDDAEEMAEEDTEDGSTGALGSFDEGIGWGTSDGTLNDMSAKGVTGNSLPNDSEVGGRSGEGRSGKSSGQFVEEEATGKGGRDTPTRLTQSPYEQGTVKDTSTDPQGGATGGGKQSGFGAEGLRGITPPRDPATEERLPGNQVELKQRAEALLRTLTVRNLPTGDLEDAIARMETIQKLGPGAPGLETKAIQSDVVAALKQARTSIEAGLQAGVDETRRRGEAPRRSLQHDRGEAVPEGYESSVSAYFRALAQGGD